MSMPKKLLLQNHEFVESHVKFYRELREHEEMFDVTLACDDYSLEAHRTIISAASKFFRSVIKNSKHQNPYIYLKGVKFEDLESLIDFIYTGETQVKSENIKRFLETADELKIAGLMADTSSDDGMSEPEPVKFKNENNKNSKKKKPKKNPPLNLGDKYQFEGEEQEEKAAVSEEANVQSEADSNIVLEETSPENSTTSHFENSQNNSDEAWKEEVEKRLKATFDRALQKPVYNCTDCDQVFQNKPKARLHVEVHIEGFSHTCTYCGAVKKTRSMLKSHIYLQHTKPKSN